MDRRAWRATVNGVAKRVGHDLATKQQQHKVKFTKKKKISEQWTVSIFSQ